MQAERLQNRLTSGVSGVVDFVRFNSQMYRDHMYAKSVVTSGSTHKELGAKWSRWETVGASPVSQAYEVRLEDAIRAKDL